VVISAGAVALGLAGAAIGTGLMAQKLHDDYEANPTRETRADGRAMRNTTNILWGVAGAMGAASVVLAIFTQWKKPDKERSSLAPELQIGVGQGGATVSVTGRF
jgi:bacteriorhodopsin